MINIVTELSKYLILTLMAVYVFYCLLLVRRQNSADFEDRVQLMLGMIILIDLVAFGVIFMKTKEIKVVLFWSLVMIYFLVYYFVHSMLYKKASRLLLTNMLMLMSVGFIIQCRLDISTAFRQLIICAGASFLFLTVPVVIRKATFLNRLTWLYAAAGVMLLGVVLVLGRTSYGAKLSIGGVQPSELIKICFVFFVASSFARSVSFPNVFVTTLVAVIHVGILVLSTDLGSGVIFFITYLVMIYVGTRKKGYLLLGGSAGTIGAVAAYYLFGHVRQRVSAWRDPMAVYENEGYQIAQSLFAIGTGGWFGMGLCMGSPNKIPIVKMDFVFSAICEELGILFGACLILVCMSFFLMIVNIAMQIKNPFYKLIAIGLGTEYAFQVFLTIGGATKFIPLTGVTLPLVSYGGSSCVSTLLVIAIIQGLYILREDEELKFERIQRSTVRQAPVYRGRTPADHEAEWMGRQPEYPQDAYPVRTPEGGYPQNRSARRRPGQENFR